MPEGRGVGGLGGKGEGIENYKCVVTNQSCDIECSVGSVANDIATIVCGARWVLEIPGDHFEKYMIDHCAVHLKLM